ncbi:hypothetical protein HMPREF9015_02156 [Leptotrichia wadei F0279]|uniref:Uncharacterized protein n=1 Tax=Leptotrichia wadei (strain F0279) TaxID=888055 RepID=U2RAZ8_LEPWF|nr:hypothetical protein HMPREF9015_02156 [Leptotrichia wadei F0279]
MKKLFFKFLYYFLFKQLTGYEFLKGQNSLLANNVKYNFYF